MIFKLHKKKKCGIEIIIVNFINLKFLSQLFTSGGAIDALFYY